jgi:hypothetical protein
LLPWQSNSGIIIFKESCYARARSTACHKLCFSYIKTDVSKGTHDYYTRFIYWKVPVGHSPRRIKPAPPDRGRWQVVERDDTAVDTQHDWTADIDPPDRGRWQAAEAADAAVDTQHNRTADVAAVAVAPRRNCVADERAAERGPATMASSRIVAAAHRLRVDNVVLP